MACSKSSDKPTDLAVRCQGLGKACADNDKHAEKLAGECTAAVPKQGCEDKTNALLDCYQRELCGASDKVWVLEDLHVRADRKSKCAAERAAVAECVGKK